jgi:hypothetical protein
LKGALVAYQLPQIVPNIIVFQYNPEQVTRSLQARTAEGGGRGEAQRTDGPPDESISLTVEIDATDQLEQPGGSLATAVGLHPVLAALETLMYPAFPTVVANQALALLGSARILAESAPLTLLVWGAARILPVRVNSVSITEEAFDPLLNPIRAKAELSLKVLTYRDLDISNPGYWVYMASFAEKEVMSVLNLGQSAQAFRGILPF